MWHTLNSQIEGENRMNQHGTTTFFCYITAINEKRPYGTYIIIST